MTGPALRSSFLLAGLLATLVGCTAAPVAVAGSMGGGMMGVVTSGQAATPCVEPVASGAVRVRLTDPGMMSVGVVTAPLGAMMRLGVAPSVVGRGTVTLVAENLGSRVHELVVLPLGAEQLAGHRPPRADGTVDEAGSLAEASADCAADAGDGIPAGSAGWTTLTLEPGRYEVLCNLENHDADGMFGEITVI